MGWLHVEDFNPFLTQHSYLKTQHAIHSYHPTQNSTPNVSVTKLDSKWTKDLNIKLDTMNLIEKEVENCFELIGTEEDFLNRTPLAHALRSIISIWSLMVLGSFCTVMDTIIQTK